MNIEVCRLFDARVSVDGCAGDDLMLVGGRVGSGVRADRRAASRCQRLFH